MAPLLAAAGGGADLARAAPAALHQRPLTTRQRRPARARASDASSRPAAAAAGSAAARRSTRSACQPGSSAAAAPRGTRPRWLRARASAARPSRAKAATSSVDGERVASPGAKLRQRPEERRGAGAAGEVADHGQRRALGARGGGRRAPSGGPRYGRDRDRAPGGQRSGWPSASAPRASIISSKSRRGRSPARDRRGQRLDHLVPARRRAIVDLGDGIAPPVQADLGEQRLGGDPRGARRSRD